MAKIKGNAAEKTAAPASQRVVEVPRPTPDQRDFLNHIELRPGRYDRSIVVGGPSRVRKPTP